MTRFLLSAITSLIAIVAFAAPPSLEVPAEITPSGEYARFTPKTDAVAITYVGLSGVDAFPSEELRDSRRFLLPTRGLAAGRYRFAAVAASKDGEQTRADFTVVVGSAPKPPAPGPGPVDPAPSGKFYFVIVRPDGPAVPAFVQYMAAAGWSELAKAGHQYKDKTLTEARALGLDIPAGTLLPCIVTLRADGTLARGPITAPQPDAISKLPEGVK